MELKTSVKSVAADEITVNVPVKIIGGGREGPPAPPRATALFWGCS